MQVRFDVLEQEGKNEVGLLRGW